jgi:hypothetical protein
MTNPSPASRKNNSTPRSAAKTAVPACCDPALCCDPAAAQRSAKSLSRMLRAPHVAHPAAALRTPRPRRHSQCRLTITSSSSARATLPARSWLRPSSTTRLRAASPPIARAAIPLERRGPRRYSSLRPRESPPSACAANPGTSSPHPALRTWTLSSQSAITPPMRSAHSGRADR